MYVTNRPVAQPTPTTARYQGPVGGNAPAPVTVPVNNYRPASGAGSIIDTISGLLSGLFNFVKGLVGKLFGAANNPGTGTVVPTPTTPTPAAPVDDATLAAQYGLLNTPENIAAFKSTLAAQQAEADVIGPGSTNTDAVRELQQLLGSWGYPVQASGQFDPATADAVMRFKTDTGLTESFKFANGAAGVTPFIDTRTRNKMIELLNSGATPAPAPGPSPVGTIDPPTVPPITPPTLPDLTIDPPAPPAPIVPPAPVVELPTPTPAPAPTPAPGPAPAGGLSAEEAAIAAEFGVETSRANFDAFMAEMAKLESQQGVVGPRLNASTDATRELQQLLKMWGYAVTETGAFDAATIAAVNKFKADNGLTYGFKMADGSAGVHPYIDSRTKDAMIAKLNG